MAPLTILELAGALLPKSTLPPGPAAADGAGQPALLLYGGGAGPDPPEGHGARRAVLAGV